MVNRIATELRRSNLTDSIKNAINDAIDEAAVDRFYFNEYTTSFVTSTGIEEYNDLGLKTLDTSWFFMGTTRYDIETYNDLDMDDLAIGNVQQSSQFDLISRTGGKFRLYPTPSSIVTVYVKGFGKLTPSPLVADADTNSWMVDGEQFIRALAKRNVLRDIVRDYGEATVYDTIAEDYKAKLLETTVNKSGVGTLRSTQF
jgi:hypothetical protein